VYYVLEALFITGAVIILLAGCWLLFNLFRKQQRLISPMILGLVGVAILVSPMAYTRLVSTVDLGERERMVDGELHLSLTGWDRGRYEFLAGKKDVVVLHMANADVTDDTLVYLEGQDKLTTLDLNDTNITDRGLNMISQLKSLRTLRLRGTAITDDGVKQLFDGLPNLTNIDLRATNVSSDWVEAWKGAQPGRRVMK
jgi:hypothetical protein